MSKGAPPWPPASHRNLTAYLGLVEEEARAVLRRRRLSYRTFLSDAVQDGFEGLARAFDRYDAEKGASFEVYARPSIRGAVIDGLRREAKAAWLRKLLERADAAAGDFAEHHEVREEDLASPAAARVATRDGAEGYLAALGLGFLGGIRGLDPEAALAAQREHARALDVVRALLAQLARREQTVLGLRQIGLHWEDVAAHMGRDRATVQRWHAAAIEQLRKGLVSRGIGGMPRLPYAGDDEEEEE